MIVKEDGTEEEKMSEETSRTMKLVVGGETRVVQDLMLRAGGSRFFEDGASGDLNAGLGYSWSESMSFDYSYHIPLDLVETNGAQDRARPLPSGEGARAPRYPGAPRWLPQPGRRPSGDFYA